MNNWTCMRAVPQPSFLVQPSRGEVSFQMVFLDFFSKTRDREFLELVVSIHYSLIGQFSICDVHNNLPKCGMQTSSIRLTWELLTMQSLDSLYRDSLAPFFIDCWPVSWSNINFSNYNNTPMSLNFLVWSLKPTSASPFFLFWFVYPCILWAMSSRTPEGIWSHCRWLWAIVQLLRIKHEPLEEQLSAVNHWDISRGPQLQLLGDSLLCYCSLPSVRFSSLLCPFLTTDLSHSHFLYL